MSLESLGLNDAAALTNGHLSIETAPIRAIDAMKGVEGDLCKPDNWAWATLKKNQRVTRADWWQDVREIELEMDDKVL